MIRRNIRKTFKQELYSEIGMAIEYIRRNISAAAELRVSFIMQVIGMMVNNITFVVIWLLFFQAFGNINGWSGKEVIALQGFLAIAYGFTFTFFSGVGELPTVIHNGAFDSILLTPRNLYLRIVTLVTRTSAVGDMAFGFILFIIYAVIGHLTASQIILMLLLLLPATAIITNFALLTSCIGFFIPDSAEISNHAFEIMFGPSLYPAGVYQGMMRIIFLFVLPTIAIAGLPVEAVKSIDMVKVLIVWILAILWTLIALWVLKKGVRHYESSNLTGARI